MKLEIITPKQICFSGEVNTVTLPGEAGLFTIWENHAPLISTLAKGKIEYTADNKTNELQVICGFVEVADNKVTVCVETD
jgi:F-type H+-transporting ATPase subunit epsilon